MKYQLFVASLGNQVCFSTKEIMLHRPDISYVQLSRWQKKWYITKVKKGWYVIKKNIKTAFDYYYIAQTIYSPSYLSLESALSYYGLIPEGVMMNTMITTRKTHDFSSPIWFFRYHHIKKSLFRGYTLVSFHAQTIKIWYQEKVILDYLYLHPEINSPEAIYERRIDLLELQSSLDIKRFNLYLEKFHSKALKKRALLLLSLINNA